MKTALKLYHYDHCPYCAKARMIFGLKGLEFNLIPLLSDDEETPISLIGQKMAPILIKEEGTAMPESLDIIKYVDDNFGDDPVVNYSNPHAEISQWLQDSRAFAHYLCMPRWVKMPLPEFETPGARLYFQEKKERLSIGSFATALEKTEEYKSMAEKSLKDLNALLESMNWYASNKPIHIDDIHLFAQLRSLTAVKNLNWPPKVLEYVKNLAQRSNVNLFSDIAL